MTLTHEQVVALPKIVLHDHLDGGLRSDTLVELAAQIGHALPSTDPTELARLFAENANSGSLVRYLEAFAHTTAVMQTEENIRRVAREAVVDLARDGVIYAELRYAPEQHLEQGLTLQQVVDAVRAGLDEGTEQAVAEGLSIRAEALLCAMRHLPRSLEIAQLALDNRGTACVGFDIAGPELGFPPADHREAFALLRDSHLAVTIHAGEADGVESVSQALGLGAARRLGHGVRIHEDIEAFGTPDAVLGVVAQHALDQQIPLECSPTSNVQTGAAASLAEHPITGLRDLGFATTINTDNRLVSGVSVSGECFALVENAGWTKEDLFEAQLTAAWAAFVPYDDRAALADAVIEGFGYEA